MTKSETMSATIKSKRNTTIDLLRIVFAILVVYIHLNEAFYDRTELSGVTLVFDSIILFAARIAVPIFFAISGYCLYRGNRQTETRVIKHGIRNCLLLLAGCFVLYMIVGTAIYGPVEMASKFTSPSLYRLIFFNQTNNIPGAGIAWYLLALALCYLIYYITPHLSPKNSNKYLVAIAAISYFIAVTASPAYSSVLLKDASIPDFISRSFISLGLPFFTVGYYLHKHQGRINRYLQKDHNNLKLLAIAIALYFIEQIIYLAPNVHRYPMAVSIFMPALVISILSTASIHPHALSKTRLPKLAAQYSLYIYIIHRAVIIFMSELLLNNIKPEQLRYYKTLLLYLATLAITIFISFVYIKVKGLIVNHTARQKLASKTAS